MPSHVLAYQVTTVAATLTNMVGLPDQVITRAQTSGVYILPAKMGLIWALGIGATMNRIQLTSPTLRQVNIMNFRPINVGAGPLSSQQVSWFGEQPPQMPALEELQPAALDTAAELATFLMVVEDVRLPIPAGPILNIRATSTTAATANQWTLLAYTLDNALPSGMYALVGSEHVSTTGLAHRWQMPGQLLRPGSLSHNALGDIQDPNLLNRKSGAFGNFVNTALPQPEVLCTAADAAHEFYMQIVPLNFALLAPRAA